MKTILILDMPKDCWDCRLARAEFMDCGAMAIQQNFSESHKIESYDKGERPSWCPLKPMEVYEEVMERIHRLEKELFE